MEGRPGWPVDVQEAPLSDRHATTRRAAARGMWAGSAWAILVLSGCSASPAMNTSTSPQPALSSVKSVDDGISEEARRLAEQAQRDVEELERLRSMPREQTASHETVLPQRPPARTPERKANGSIQWLETPKIAATAPEAKPAIVQEPLGNKAATGSAAEGSLDQDRLSALIIDLSREAYREAALKDMPLREMLTIAALSMARPDRTLNPDAIPDLSERERIVLAKMQGFFADLGQRLEKGEDAETVIVEAVNRLRAELAEKPLRLPRAAMCTAVRTFGDYDAFDRYAFLSGQPQPVIVYVEVEGFTSEINAKDEWETRLAQQLVIYADSDGIPVWSEEWQPVIDRSKNARRDFFQHQIITLPRALSVGKYQLKIRVRDEKSGAEAETSIPFQMVADPKMAVGGK